MKKEYLQFRPNTCIRFNRIELSPEKRTLMKWKLKERKLEKKPYSGLITVGAKKRLRRATNILIMASEKKKQYSTVLKKNVMHQLSMITLTQPTNRTSKDPKECYRLLLKPFLQWLTKTEKVTMYIWKLELQHNGNIHYHIISNAFIEHYRIKEKWNYLLRSNGLLREYVAKGGNYNPNSTDIHELNNVDNAAAYIEKYISKEYQNTVELKCKVWDCSYNLKASKLFEIEPMPVNNTNLDKLITDSLVRVMKEDYYTSYDGQDIKPHNILYGYQHQMYREWLNNIYTCKRIVNELRKKFKRSNQPIAAQQVFF